MFQSHSAWLGSCVAYSLWSIDHYSANARWGESSVIIFVIKRRIVVCAIGWGKRVFCTGAVNYYISVANFQPAGSGVIRLPFLVMVLACACLR